MRVDYLAPTLYFLDILIVLFLGSDLLRKSWPTAKMFSRTSKINSETRSDPQGILVILVPLLLTSLLFSSNPLSTLSWSLHLLLYLLFFSTILPIKSKFENLRIYDFKLILTLALLFQLTLSLSQVSLGHSVGGLMYYLGERSVSVGQPAVALGEFMNQVVLRAYGTFGHPNVLAGWSVVSLLILIQISQTATPKASKQRVVRGSDPLRKSWLPAKMFSRLQNAIWRPGQTLWVLTVISIVLLTESRAAALSLFGLIIPFYLIKTLKLRILYFAILISLVIGHWSLVIPARSDLSLSQRLALQGSSLSIIRSLPIFGAGAQSSISTYPVVNPNSRLLQPDHNSLTLFLSWFGLFGVLAILYSLRSQFENLRIWDLRFVLPLLPLLLLDHYFLTSPQGLFILLLYLKLNYSHA